jgi:asparagine synthase (glutamine-hydrolysing)
LLAALGTFGLQKTLEGADGMFAFALWDRKSRTLTLVRDRMGEKPLYVGWVGRAIAFCSEPIAFSCLPDWTGEIDKQALGYLLRYGFIPAPLSIFKHIYKLPPAHFIQLSIKDCDSILPAEAFMKRCTCYWHLPSIVTNTMRKDPEQEETDAVAHLDKLLSENIRLRMVADVSVGSLLSGGIDSSLVTALMQANSPRPVKTFTIGFHENAFDEARYAKPVAAHLGCDHTEIMLSPKDALNIIPNLPQIYSEPFADPSQIPTALVSAVARRSVTVALSGDGGDELFGGYTRYETASHFWRIMGRLPPWLRVAAGNVLSETVANALPFHSTRRGVDLGFKLRRLGKRLAAKDLDSYYANLLSLSLTPTASTHWPAGLPILCDNYTIPPGLDLEQRMMYVDQVSYLPDNILVKSDRASMAASLELRIPLLDHKIVEFAWSLPPHLRRRGNQGKWLLRKLLYEYVPEKLVKRPKKGFDIPIDEWLRGPLREWMQDLTTTDALNHGYLDKDSVATIVQQHLSGRTNYGYTLWPVLMFQAWFAQQQSSP